MNYKLTTPQLNIWNVQKYYPETGISNIGGLLIFEAEYDYEYLNLAANQILADNDALRLRFGEKDGQPYQYLADYRSERIKAALEFGLLPDYLLTLYAEFSPVDSTASAVLKIARHFNERYTVFHVNSHKPLYFDKLLQFLPRLGITMRVTGADEFAAALQAAAKATGTEYIYKAFINDLDAQDRLAYDTNISIENAFTVWYLNRLGFDWPETDFAYVQRYIEYFRNKGYLGV